MKTALQLLAMFFLSTVLLSSGCKKSGGGGGGGGGGTTEADLAVTTNPANGSVQTPSLGPFDLSVTITSAMPSGGVKIEVTAKREDNSLRHLPPDHQ